MVQRKDRDEQLNLFQVPRANLKIYATLKTEAASNVYRRPENEYKVLHQKFHQQVAESPAHFKVEEYNIPEEKK